MHLWDLEDWKKYIDLNKVSHRTGIYLIIDKNVDVDVRDFCKKFAKWLRKEFFFPTRVNVYIKGNYRIKAKDGEMVVGTFWRPGNYEEYPYIRLATGDYQELVSKKGKEGAMWDILWTFAHELTHYFQYVNNVSLTRIGEERQATRYSRYILSDYDDYIKRESIK